MTESVAKSPLPHRQAGVLLHPTSLPGRWETGDLGIDAYRFVDFLAEARQSVWQILPLGPTHDDRSPYQTTSIHAGDPRLISLERLAEEGWIEEPLVPGPEWERRRHYLLLASKLFHQRASDVLRQEYEQFCQEHGGWLEDFALYRVLRELHQRRGWSDWPEPLRDRHPDALETIRQSHSGELACVRFEQWSFFRQWHALKRYANDKGIILFGDMPIFVAHDSADVWAGRDNFLLDAGGQPTVVAGVPPDYFSATGQRWGNPHYDWERMAADGFAWWRCRMENALKLYDLVRIDHFRGFEAYWEVPAAEETAINGRWVKGPGEAFFAKLRECFDPLPVVAEDLGTITEEVHQLRHRYALPGMKILQFAFDSGADNPYLPHNHEENCVVYTGTHDNDTTLGWILSMPEASRAYLQEYLGHPEEEMPWPLVRACYRSVARMAIVPFQDLLGLDSEHRMNRPGTPQGNWCWRFHWEMVPEGLAPQVGRMVEVYGRYEETH